MIYNLSERGGDRRGRDRMVVGSVPTATDVVSSNLDQDEVYNINLIKFVSLSVCPGPLVSSTKGASVTYKGRGLGYTTRTGHNECLL